MIIGKKSPKDAPSSLLIKVSKSYDDTLSMETLVKKIQRNNHLDHLSNVAPLITVAYGIQCWLISTLFQGQKLSHFAIPLAISLIVMITCLVIYDAYYHIELHDEYIEIRFKMFGIKQKIEYKDINAIEVLDEEASFSNMVVQLKDESHKLFYFIDDAKDVKDLIFRLMNNEAIEDVDNSQDQFNQAA